MKNFERILKQSETQNETEGVKDNILIENKEKESKKENLENLPELVIDKRIIKEVMPEALEKAKEEHGDSWYLYIEDYIDVDKARGIVYSQDVAFESREKKRQELINQALLPEDKLILGKIKNIFQEIPDQLKGLNLAPQDLHEKLLSSPPIEIEYNSEKNYARYIDSSIIQLASSDEQPKSYLQIGGRIIQETTAKLQNKIIELGLEITKEESLDIVLKHAMGHEYAHVLLQKYESENIMDNHPFFEKAKQISKSILTNEDDASSDIESPIFSERFAQSIAEQIIDQELRRKGYAEEIILVLKKEIGGQNDKIIKQYQEVIEVGQKQNAQSSEISNFLLYVHSALDRNGYEQEAEKIDYTWRNAGYYASVFDKEQLKFIMHGD